MSNAKCAPVLRLTDSIGPNKDYTINDLRAVIPPHCFKPNTFTSTLYILRDLLLVSIILYLGLHIPSIENDILRRLCYALYSLCQGFAFTALWLIAHECGHGALSKHKSFNHGVGLVVHSLLLTPYHSWRFSHQTHHKKTNNLDGDIGFIPPTAAQFNKQSSTSAAGLHFHDLFEDTPIGTLLFLIVYQLVAWPCYLILNNSSLARITRFEWWKRSHFYLGGDGPSFAPRHFWGILVSDISIASTCLCLWLACRALGSQTVMLYYGLPFLWTNHWMVVITYLQHTDPRLPFYTASSFTFLRGAASTMDRDFGFILRHLWHGTTNYHVLHHHFSTIPFYHAREASEAIQKVMGDSYMSDNESGLLQAFWNNHRVCKYVKSEVGQPVEDEIYYFAKAKPEKFDCTQSGSIKTSLTSSKRLDRLGHMLTSVLQHQDITNLATAA